MKQFILPTLLASLLLMGCSKAWLDEPSSKQLAIPTTIKDVRAMLDNLNIFNGLSIPFTLHELAEISADNFAMNNNTLLYFDTYDPMISRAYRFEADIFAGLLNVRYWNISYQRIFTANVALETLDKLDQADPQTTQLRGEALFHRANAYYWLSQLFIAPYDPSNAVAQLGLPLRLIADPNQLSVRSTVEEAYQTIIANLRESAESLSIDNEGLRPIQSAAYALLSRVWLSMNVFDSAAHYANKCLQLTNGLLDYNTINPLPDFPIPKNNVEVLFSDIAYSSVTHPIFCEVSGDLYNAYEENDLRRNIFFKIKPDGKFSFNGGYDGSFALFSGVTINEIYLTKAECAARSGDEDIAREAINTLLVNRYVTGEFTPITATGQELLDIILTERRKELCFRGLRWTDIRRLNLLGALISITHEANGEIYTLPANDRKFVMPIPDDVIRFTGMEQNPR